MYEIQITHDDGITQKQTFKSIREMSKKTGISYHNLKVLYGRKNEQSEKYKNTSVNNLSKYVKIYYLNPNLKLLEKTI